MVFIFSVNFAESRVIKKCLETFYGIGKQHSARLLAKHSIFPGAKVGDVPTKTIIALNVDLTELKIENDLRRELRTNINRLREMGTHRGRRHAMGYPVRGQRTRSQILTSRKLNRLDRVG